MLRQGQHGGLFPAPSALLDNFIHGVDIGEDTGFYHIAADSTPNHLMAIITYLDRAFTHGFLPTGHDSHRIIFQLYRQAGNLVHGFISRIHRAIAVCRDIFAIGPDTPAYASSKKIHERGRARRRELRSPRRGVIFVQIWGV